MYIEGYINCYQPCQVFRISRISPAFRFSYICLPPVLVEINTFYFSVKSPSVLHISPDTTHCLDLRSSLGAGFVSTSRGGLKGDYIGASDGRRSGWFGENYQHLYKKSQCFEIWILGKYASCLLFVVYEIWSIPCLLCVTKLNY